MLNPYETVEITVFTIFANCVKSVPAVKPIYHYKENQILDINKQTDAIGQQDVWKGLNDKVIGNEAKEMTTRKVKDMATDLQWRNIS